MIGVSRRPFLPSTTNRRSIREDTGPCGGQTGNLGITAALLLIVTFAAPQKLSLNLRDDPYRTAPGRRMGAHLRCRLGAKVR